MEGELLVSRPLACMLMNIEIKSQCCKVTLFRSGSFFVKLEEYISDLSKVTKRKIVFYLNSRYKLVGRQS